MGKGVERGEGKISIIKMELVSELQRQIAFLPFHFSDRSRLLSHIYHVIPLTQLLILSWRVLHRRNRDISLYGLHLLL